LKPRPTSLVHLRSLPATLREVVATLLLWNSGCFWKDFSTCSAMALRARREVHPGQVFHEQEDDEDGGGRGCEREAGKGCVESRRMGGRICGSEGSACLCGRAVREMRRMVLSGGGVAQPSAFLARPRVPRIRPFDRSSIDSHPGTPLNVLRRRVLRDREGQTLRAPSTSNRGPLEVALVRLGGGRVGRRAE